MPDDRHERLAYFGDIGGDRLMGFCALVNTIVVVGASDQLDVPVIEHKTSNGDLVAASLAKPEERLGVFSAAADNMRSIAHDAQSVPGTTFYGLERVADQYGLATVLAHPKTDGNGRTARVGSELIISGVDDPDRLRALSVNRQGKGGAIKPYGPFNPRVDESHRSRIAFLDLVRARDVPIDDSSTYLHRSTQIFSSPHH